MSSLTKKSKVIDQVWLYSRYFGNQLTFLNGIEDNGAASVVYLLNLLENIIKNHLDDYESNFQIVVKKAFEAGALTQVEYEFLNNKKNGIRRIRNIFSHANLSGFSFKLESGDELYPLTENENCMLLYSKISDVLFNIIYKIVSISMGVEVIKNIDFEISKLKIDIVIMTPEDIFLEKGVDPKILPGWNDLPQSEKYRHAENAPNAKIISHLVSGILRNR